MKTKNSTMKFDPSLLAPANFSAFSFPLNVYAYAQLLEEGQVQYLHYGLFKNADNSLSQAQLHSTELLLAQLPAPPCRILEIGVGLGTTLKLLTEKGYQIQGITPDPAQVSYICRTWREDAPVSCQRLEDFSAEAESFDVILFQESAQYIDPLVIFNQTLDFLRPSGSLLIIDEFALRRTDPRLEGLHLRSDLLAQAQRFGFDLVEQQDLSELAAPTLQYLLKVTTKHRQQLIDILSLTPECLDKLDQSNKSYQAKYRDGRYGYGLLHFHKSAPPKWRLNTLDSECMNEMLALFEKSFNHKMSPTLWLWKYGSERAPELGVWENNQLIAHYGGMPRDILYFGERQQAIQIGDVMVDPSRRGLLTRQGAFFRMAATFLERYIGYGKPFLLGFGFPNERAMKVAEYLGLYAEVDHMVEVSWSPLKARPSLFTCLRIANKDTIKDEAPAIDHLWYLMSQDLHNAIVGIRDWRYIQVRYLNHPDKHYQFLLVKNRWNGRLRGLIVLNPQGNDIVDLIAPLKDIQLLIFHARRFAQTTDCDQLTCQITKAFAMYFKTLDCQHQALNIRIPSNVWSAGPSPESLRDRWWLMSGDIDCR